MRARVFSIKKSTLLSLSLAVNTIFFFFFFVLSVLFLKNYNLWFFIFCFFIGLHLINKSLLFKFDSSCYFGVLLLFIGLLYFLAFFFNIMYIYSVFVASSFSIASFSTYVFFKQSFQLFLALSLFFVTIGLLLFVLKLISVWIFVAIISASVILLVVRYFTLNRSK